MNSQYETYVSHNRKIALLNTLMPVLTIDSILYLPEKAADSRSEQEGILGEIIHNLTINEAYVALCKQLNESDLDEIRKKNVAISVKDIIKNQKIPTSFVKAYKEQLSASEITFYKARTAKDFSMFSPYLEKNIEFAQRYSELMGVKTTPYDVHLDDYDEGLTEEVLDKVFEQIRLELVPIVKKIYALKREGTPIIINTDDTKKNKELFTEILNEMGYDMDKGGVLDGPSSFMNDGNPNDARMMIRNSGKILDMIGSVIHEGGHGIYEQNFNPAFMGLPMSQATSYSLHESQSRLYELHIGNSKEYLSKILEKLKKYFPEDTKSLTIEELYFAANTVCPMARRVESDEISYHIHIMIRYEIERDLINGKLKVSELKDTWNKKYKEYLGIEFKDEGEGILQDIHWAGGNFGYFPTYSVGTFYSAQFYAKLEEVIPDMKEKISRGELLEIKNWLNENVHSYGRLKTSAEILKAATGKDIDISIFINRIKSKYSELYSIEL